MPAKNRKDIILEFLSEHTESALTQNRLDTIGYDASVLSIDLKIERSNISRTLNDLCRDGYLTKIQGRPTLYIARAPLLKYFPNIYIPLIIPKGKSLIDYIDTLSQQEARLIQKTIRSIIGGSPHESLHRTLMNIEETMLYPNNQLLFLISGSRGSGLMHLTRYIVDYGSSIDRFKKNYRLIDINLARYAINTHMFQEDIDTFFEVKNAILVFHETKSISRSHIDYINYKAEAQVHTPACIIFLDTAESLTLLAELPYLQRISLPTLDERTLKEKLEITLSFLQQEADMIHASISITTGVLSCFVMSKYSQNISGLKTQIRRSVTKSYMQAKRRNATILNLDFDSLDDEVLDNIYDVSNRIGQLYSLFDLLESELLIFIPNSQNKNIAKIRNSLLNQQYMIEHTHDSSLISYAKSVIAHVENVEMNTIRSILISDVYNLLYPVLCSTSLADNEKIMYGFFLEISKILENHSDVPDDYLIHETETYPTAASLEISEAIINRIIDSSSYKLKQADIDFIHMYIALAFRLTTHSPVPILILCHGESIAENYAKYISSVNDMHQCYYLNYTLEDQKNSFTHFINRVCEYVRSIDLGRGVVIITDVEPLTSLDNTILTQTHIRTLTLSPISLPLLLNVVEFASSIDYDLDDIKAAFEQKQIAAVADETPETRNNPSYKLIDDIASKILANSLIFLDPQKITTVLFGVLLKILEDLQLNYSDEITIRFLIHSSFMVERSIKGDALKSKRLAEVINKYNKIFHCIDKHFIHVNKVFGIKISQSEISLVTEIFVDYIENRYPN